MATIYVGPNSDNYAYTTISAGVSAAASGDTILVRPGQYDADDIAINNKSLTIKADWSGYTPQDFDPDGAANGGGKSWPAYIYHYTTGLQQGNFDLSIGHSGPETLIIEGFKCYSYDQNDQARGLVNMQHCGKYANVIINKCRIGSHACEDLVQGVLEVRNCYHSANQTFLGNNVTAMLNVIKCRLNTAMLTFGTAASTWSPQILDYVPHGSDIEGYGTEYGPELVSVEYPKVAGYLKENGTPVQRTLLLIRRSTGQVLKTQVSAADGYYEFPCRHLMNTELSLVALKDSGSLGSTIIIDRIIPVDPRA